MGRATKRSETLTKKRLDLLVTVWRKRMRLSDWDVRALLVDADALASGGNGECSVYPRLNQAVIRIASNRELGDGTLHDHEATLVHELLHIDSDAFVRYTDLKRDSLRFDAYENFIEKTSQVLVGAYRKGGK